MGVEIREAKSIYDHYSELSGEMLETAIREHLSWALGALETDARLFARRMHEVNEGDTWKRVASNWNEFCERFTGMSADRVSEIRRGVEALGYEVPIPAEQARKAVADKAREQAEHRKQQGRPKNLDNVKVFKITDKGGNSAAYLLRRMARDHPEILEAYERGEYRSARAAAMAAGIPVGNMAPLEKARQLVKKLTKEEREQLCRELMDGLQER